MRYAVGELVNLLERARSVVSSPAADSLFPLTRLWDGYLDAVARLSSNAANPSITADLALLDSTGGDNGNLDTWAGGLPTAWTVSTTGTGTVTQETVTVRSGSAAKLLKGTGTAKIIKTYKVRSGERLTVELYARLVSAGGVGSFQLFNPVTKKYWTGSVWQTAQAYWATEGGTAYVQKTTAPQVEDFAANQNAVTYLELTADDTSTNGLFVEDAFIWPTWNALVVAGHNVEPGLAPELRSSTDNFVASDVLEQALTVRRPEFFGYLSTPSTKRYLRFIGTGAQSSQAGAPYVGELVPCYLETALTYENWEWEMQFLEEQIRNVATGSRVSVNPRSIDARRVLRMTFSQRSDAAYREARDEIIRRSRGGQWPAIVVPMDAEDIVLHARLDSSWNVVRSFISGWGDDLTFSENPLPQVTS